MKFALWIIFILCSLHMLQAQTTPIGALRPYLDTLNTSQKVELLDYMRHLGVGIDRQVAQSFLELDKKKQDRVLQYIRLQLMKKPEGEADERTTVRFVKDTLFLGRLDEGSIVSDSFLVTNTGSRPYLIKEIKASCDCTVLRRPEYPLMPGETAAIRIDFDTRGKIGVSTPGVVIYDNSRPNGRQIVYLQADIVPRVKPKNMSGN